MGETAPTGFQGRGATKQVTRRMSMRPSDRRIACTGDGCTRRPNSDKAGGAAIEQGPFAQGGSGASASASARLRLRLRPRFGVQLQS